VTDTINSNKKNILEKYNKYEKVETSRAQALEENQLFAVEDRKQPS